MATCSLQQLLTDANANLFNSVGETTQRALLLQLLCQLATEGVGTDSYTLHASAAASAAGLGELTIYYFGYNAAKEVQIIDTVGRIRVPKTGTITSVCGSVGVGAVATDEAVQFSIFNATANTTTAIGAMSFSSADLIASMIFTGLSVPVTAGDQILLRFDTPVWVLDPGRASVTADIFIET